MASELVHYVATMVVHANDIESAHFNVSCLIDRLEDFVVTGNDVNLCRNCEKLRLDLVAHSTEIEARSKLPHHANPTDSKALRCLEKRLNEKGEHLCAYTVNVRQTSMCVSPALDRKRLWTNEHHPRFFNLVAKIGIL